ncbi:hypothetical protein BDQ17DRAFT_1329246 [Cyathus striatus]|nr:hypothetical protein BDQ17DRAFT_1329246 [Cyathus striatus]
MPDAFHQASNFTINGLNQTDIRNDSDQRKDKAFERLQKEVVAGASYNSGERYDAPKCHPDTRKAVLSNIMSWVDSDDELSRMMWLHGQVGAGKSAIAQTIAEESDTEGKLVASFFFSRFSPGRNNKNGLIATIAFQLCISVPAAKEHVIKNIKENPKIFESNIWSQMRALVIEPFSHAKFQCGVIPRLIIIDGLDECLIRKDQAEIIEAIAKSLSMKPSSGLRVLLISRPEVEIRQAFNMDNVSALCTRLVLNDTFDPDKDIELYLRSRFEALKRQHKLGLALPISWPSDEAIQQIVEKSSGQFIYASTVLNMTLTGN